MTDSTLTAPAVDDRTRLAGVAAVFIALALTGLPYLALGSLEPYVVIFPVAAGALAIALYAISRPVYVGFSLWIWFLSPFVRRLVDYYGVGAYTNDSLVLTAPLLVGGVGVLGLWTLLTSESRGVKQAFTLMFVALVYGGAVGFVTNGVMKMGLSGLEWGIPLVTFALILVDWRQYPRYRDVVLRTITVGMAVLGLYGIYQFFVLPPWDRMWMEETTMMSLGKPVPMQVRVFGTLNSPNPFAITMVVGLLGLLASDSRSRTDALMARLAAVPAGLALALSMVRSGWGAYAVGLLYILFMTKSANRWRVLLFIGLAAAAVVPLLQLEPVAMRVTDRASTITDLSNDGSFNARLGMYSTAIPAILQNPVGWGLGLSGSIDSGIVQTLAMLGWGGTALYMLGFALLCLWAWRVSRQSSIQAPFVSVAMGIVVALTATLPFGNPFLGVKGVYLWGFLALALAGIRYHHAERLIAPTPPTPRSERRPEAVPG